jgi:purine-cytosine permease-like protein
VDETAAGWTTLRAGASRGAGSFFALESNPLGSRAVHRPNFPSIDPGVMAFLWAVLLAIFVYFGLKAVGASGAFSIVLALLAFAAIWLFVRLRGEDRPGV